MIIDEYEEIGDAIFRMIALEARVEELTPLLAHGRGVHRAWVERVFAEWLPKRGAERERRTVTLVAATDVLTWKILRREQELSREEAELAMRETVTALVERAGVRRAMSRILITLWDGGGNSPPVLSVARALVDRGHDVRVLADQSLGNAVGARGRATPSVEYRAAAAIRGPRHGVHPRLRSTNSSRRHRQASRSAPGRRCAGIRDRHHHRDPPRAHGCGHIREPPARLADRRGRRRRREHLDRPEHLPGQGARGSAVRPRPRSSRRLGRPCSRPLRGHARDQALGQENRRRQPASRRLRAATDAFGLRSPGPTGSRARADLRGIRVRRRGASPGERPLLRSPAGRPRLGGGMERARWQRSARSRLAEHDDAGPGPDDQTCRRSARVDGRTRPRHHRSELRRRRPGGPPRT